MEIQHISSLQNQKIKNLVLLQQKSAERRKQNCFVVEGQRELQHCLSAGFCIESVFFCRNLSTSISVSYQRNTAILYLRTYMKK